MTFKEKLTNVVDVFRTRCTSIIVVGENIILTTKCLEDIREENKEAVEALEQYFYITDVYALHLSDEYREAFDIIVTIGDSTVYIAGAWESRIFVVGSLILNIRNRLKWADDNTNRLLAQLTWEKPLNPHEIAVKANKIFGLELYRVYDVVPFYGQAEEWDNKTVIDLVSKRYIEIDLLPMRVLESINETIDECDLMEHDIIRLFDCHMTLTSERVNKLKVSEIAKARVRAMKAFEDEMKKLLPNEDEDTKEAMKLSQDTIE